MPLRHSGVMRFPNPHLYAWLTFFCFGLLTSSVKALHGEVPVSLIMGVRSVLGILFLMPLVYRQGGVRETVRTRYPFLQVIRGLIGISALALNFWALPQLPLADANGLGQIYPVFLVVLAPFILKEYAGAKQWLALAIGLSGAMLIAQPHGASAALIPALCMIGSAFVSALGDLIVRYMARHDHSLTITIWFFGLVSVLTLGWWLLYYGPMPLTLRQIALLGAIGLVGAFAQMGMVQSFKLLPAATMGVYSSLGLMWAVIFGWLFFGETPSWWLAGGAALILTASWLTSYTPPKRAPVQGNLEPIP
jgi:drug/metabolite transporter (DMT)-like permease